MSPPTEQVSLYSQDLIHQRRAHPDDPWDDATSAVCRSKPGGAAAGRHTKTEWLTRWLCESGRPHFAEATSRELYRPEKGSLFTPGHEVAGDVVATDEREPPTCRRSSRTLLLDRVRPLFALSPGALNMCRSSTTLGFSHDGGDAEYVVVPEHVCLPIPDTMSYEVAALIGDGVGTPYRAITKAGGVRGGQTLGVFGLGHRWVGRDAFGRLFRRPCDRR